MDKESRLFMGLMQILSYMISKGKPMTTYLMMSIGEKKLSYTFLLKKVGFTGITNTIVTRQLESSLSCIHK